MEKNQIWTMLLLVVVVSVIASYATVKFTGGNVTGYAVLNDTNGTIIGNNSSNSTYFAWITANPNPCVITSGSSCTSQITWDSKLPVGWYTQVWVSDGKTDSVFACAPSGSRPAAFIQYNATYKFRIYPGTTCNGNNVSKGSLLASVDVTATKPVEINANSCNIDGICEITNLTLINKAGYPEGKVVNLTADGIGRFNIQPQGGVTNIYGSIASSSLLGVGNGFVCADSAGRIYRSSTACV